MKKLIIITLAMLFFIGCSESGNSVAAIDFDTPEVENDSTKIDTIDTIDIDSVKEVKDTIINTKKNKEESSSSKVVTSSSSKVEDKSSSSINNKKEKSSSSIEKKNESSSSEKVVVSSSSKENVVSSSSEKKVESSSSEKIVASSSSELIVSSSSEKVVVSSSSKENVVSSSSEKKVESSSSEVIVNSSSSVNDDFIDENEPKRTVPSYVELDELKLDGFKVEHNTAYLSWENNTDYTMQINVTYRIGCNLVGVDSTIVYTIKANSVKEKAIYEIKNNATKCVGEIKSIIATENDKSNFAGWKMGSDRGVEYISFKN
jgi:hypothetical protein